MPKDVRKAILHVFSQHGCLNENECLELLRKMEREKRFIVEAWS